MQPPKTRDLQKAWKLALFSTGGVMLMKVICTTALKLTYFYFDREPFSHWQLMPEIRALY